MKPKRSIDAATLATSPRFGFPSHGVKTSGGIHTAAATYLANRAGTPPEGSSSEEPGKTPADERDEPLERFARADPFPERGAEVGRVTTGARDVRAPSRFSAAVAAVGGEGELVGDEGAAAEAELVPAELFVRAAGLGIPEASGEHPGPLEREDLAQHSLVLALQHAPELAHKLEGGRRGDGVVDGGELRDRRVDLRVVHGHEPARRVAVACRLALRGKRRR